MKIICVDIHEFASLVECCTRMRSSGNCERYCPAVTIGGCSRIDMNEFVAIEIEGGDSDGGSGMDQSLHGNVWQSKD